MLEMTSNEVFFCFKTLQFNFTFQNLPVERFWVEMNGRVNYPLKTALVWLDNNNIFDINDEIQKYSVSQVSMAVAKYGASICIRSWNEHHIRGKKASLHL